MQGFGARIREAILLARRSDGRRYTNVQFGIDVGVAEKGRAYSTQAVSEWIAERSEPSISTFRAMAKVTGRPIDWLMALDVEPKEDQTPTARVASPPPPMYYGTEVPADEAQAKPKPAKKTRRRKAG